MEELNAIYEDLASSQPNIKLLYVTPEMVWICHISPLVGDLFNCNLIDERF